MQPFFENVRPSTGVFLTDVGRLVAMGTAATTLQRSADNMVKVFIQNEAGSDQKHRHNEKTLEYRHTVTVCRPYPFPYGFILDTTSPDGDNLDCYVLTREALKSGSIVECEVVGLLEQLEDGREDHNVLANLSGESVPFDDRVMAIFEEFITHVFDHIPGKQISVGRFLAKEAAEAHIRTRLDR